MLTMPLSTAPPPPYQCFSWFIRPWSPGGVESQDPASETPLLPYVNRLKPTFPGVLNQWRRFSEKSVMRVSVGRSNRSCDDTPGAKATVAPGAAGRMGATSGSDPFVHDASGAVYVGSPAPELLMAFHALLP